MHKFIKRLQLTALTVATLAAGSAQAWTVKLIDNNVGFTSKIQECWDRDGHLALFALNFDHSIWIGAANGHTPNWKFYQQAPSDAHDLLCVENSLAVVLPSRLQKVRPDMPMAVDEPVAAMAEVLSFFSISSIDESGIKDPNLSALKNDHTIVASLAVEDGSSEWMETAPAFPYVVKVDASLARWKNGAISKPAALFGLDQDQTRFWYSDGGGQPGTWEMSTLSIPYNESNNGQTDFSVGIGSVHASETRRMTGLYVLRNGSLYWAVP